MGTDKRDRDDEWEVLPTPVCTREGHNFTDFIHALGGRPLMFCRRCGDVRPLELPADGRPAPRPSLDGSFMGRV